MLLLLGTAPAAAAEQIRFAVASGLVQPFIHLQGSQLSGGLVYELMEQVAREAGAEAQYFVLPPRRAVRDMADGRVDMQCLVSPAWRSNVPSTLWSLPLFALEDVLLAGPTFHGELRESHRANATDAKLKLGLVKGNSYPGIKPLLDRGQWQIDTAPSLQTMFEKLSRGRTDLAVSSRTAAVQFNKGQVTGSQVRILQTVDLHWGHCVASARSAYPAAQLLAAVNRVAHSKEWHETLARYQIVGPGPASLR